MDLGLAFSVAFGIWVYVAVRDGVAWVAEVFEARRKIKRNREGVEK